ncbi:MAG: RDD family protein [Actinobacteria bacterium]|nr:RDD family protein [Actinomycetota bacterium]
MTQPPQMPLEPGAYPQAVRPTYTAGQGGYRAQGQPQQAPHGSAIGVGGGAQASEQQGAPPLRYSTQSAGRSSGEMRATAALARSRAWARPASIGLRLLSFTIDLLIAGLLATVASVALGHWLFALIVLLEYAVIVMILESRTGATPAQFMLRIRTTRDDSPFSLGFARALGRALVQAAGSLLAGIGGWIVVATAASDPKKANRSIADRVGQALVVKVPTRAERAAEAERAAALAAHGPRVSITRAGAAPIAMQQVPTRQYAVRTPGQSALVPQAGVSAQLPAPIAPPPLTSYEVPWESRYNEPGLPMYEGSASAPAAPFASVVAAASAIPAAPAAPEAAAQRVLLRLSFDTGQSQLVAAEGSILLGRKPDASTHDEQLVSVRDPDGTVSKTHLRIDVQSDTLWLADLGSTNGSEVFDEMGEGTELRTGHPVRFEVGSRVRIGHRSFTIAIVEGV